MNALLKTLRRLRFEYRSIVASEPRLWLLHRPNIWWQQYKIWRYYRDVGGTIDECIVGPHAELVLDGFQGSGNSFASEAFQRSQGRPVKLVHHLHSPAQIIEAVRMGLPTLVTIRQPADAVVSLVSRWPYISLPQALRSYVRFYRKIEPFAHGYVLSPFEQTTRHLDEAIRAVNHRFDTDFRLFEYSDENIARAQRDPAELSSEEERAREAVKAQKAEALKAPECARLLAEAEALHQRLLAHAAST